MDAGTITACIECAELLLALYQSFSSAEKELSETVLHLEAFWFKAKYQLEFIHEKWSVFDDDFRIHQLKLLDGLEKELRVMTKEVEKISFSYERDGRSLLAVFRRHGKKLKYAVLVKESLETMLKKLGHWQDSFDMSWYLILRQPLDPLRGMTDYQNIEVTRADTPVRSLLRLSRIDHNQASAEDLLLQETCSPHEELPCSSAVMVWYGAHEAEEALILDTIVQASYSQQKTGQEDIKRIVTTLQAIEPVKFGLLQCRGVIKSHEGQAATYQFAFTIPPHTHKPRSLRDLLLGDKPYTLNQRLQVAKQMSRAVMLVHATSFVHKNIRPATVIVLEEKKDPQQVWPFLVGFETFRPAEGQTFRQGDESWGKNLYRHPERQGLRPDRDFRMQDDIYSLGVCLLEIGFWHSFLLWLSEKKIFQPDPDLKTDGLAKRGDMQRNAVKTKKILVALAKEKLPYTMGNLYTNLVVTCLTCLDKSSNAFGTEDELDDDDKGISVALRYIEVVWTALQDIAV